MDVAQTRWHSWCSGNLSEGCKRCVEGRKLVLFITGMCAQKCWYCPIGEQKYGHDVVFANEWKLDNPNDPVELLEEARLTKATGAGITGGDPLARIDRCVQYITLLKKEFGMDMGHNDLILLDRGDFGIENVQEIVDVNSRKPTVGMYKVIVVVLHSISHQAQNAILKTLEEPRPGTFIFILTNTSAIFLPTILSRVQVVRSLAGADKSSIASNIVTNIDLDATAFGATALDAKKFVKSSSVERLTQIKEILDLKSDEEIGDAEIFAFVQEVEKLAVEFAQSSKGFAASTLVAQIFTKVEDYMRDTSSSKKLLLEYMALRLPNF